MGAELSASERRLVAAFQRLGMSEQGAREAALPGGGGDRFDRVAANFRRFGLSESAAKTAAIGTARSEHEARADFGARDELREAWQRHAELVESRIERLRNLGRSLDEARREVLVDAYVEQGMSAADARARASKVLAEPKRTGQAHTLVEQGKWLGWLHESRRGTK